MLYLCMKERACGQTTDGLALPESRNFFGMTCRDFSLFSSA